MSPILYSFRRCPYAMRARLAIKSSGIRVQLREIVLRNKPSEMLAVSPKGTVPVLTMPDNKVIDESLDIMLWALEQNDPNNWLAGNPVAEATCALIHENDYVFKKWLDKYKYYDRYPEYPQAYYRTKGEAFLEKLELRLHSTQYLTNENIGFSDVAIFPFIRQFANTDKEWFYSTNYYQLQKWLSSLVESELFNSIMKKYAPWERSEAIIYL